MDSMQVLQTLNRTLSSQDGKLGCAGGDEIWFNQLTIHFKCIR